MPKDNKKTRNKDKNQHQKCLTILNIIRTFSDCDHPLTISKLENIISEKNLDFKIDFRLLRKYIQYFNECIGEIVLEKKGRELYFYYNHPALDVFEAKAIIDLVYSSNFFSQNTKENYIYRMQDLFPTYYSDLFKKPFIFENTKPHNDNLFYQKLYTISEAICNHTFISFSYEKPSLIQKKSETNDTSLQTQKIYAPLDTIFSNNEYYLLCIEKESIEQQELFNPKTLRMDYITNVQTVLDNKTFTLSEIQKNKIMSIIQQSTYMYSDGDIEEIQLSFPDYLYGNMIDKFGKIDPSDIEYREERYVVTVKPIVNRTFYSWIIGFGGDIQIVGDAHQIEKFKTFLKTNFLNKEK